MILIYPYLRPPARVHILEPTPRTTVLDPKGGIRFCIHGSPSIANIAADPNGFNLTFAGNTHGSLLGSGIYLGYDDYVAHNYFSGSPSGNVFYVLSGWLPSSEWTRYYPDPKSGLNL